MTIGGDDDTQPEEAQPSATRTATPPPSPSPPIAPPSSPLPGTTAGLGRRLLGSIRALAALPASPPPPAAAPPNKVGLGLLLHLRPDHPLLHPPTPPASPSKEPASDAAPAPVRPHAHATDAGPRSPVRTPDAAAAATSSAPTGTSFGQWAAKRAPSLLQYLRPAADPVDGRQLQAEEELRAGDGSSPTPTHVASPPEDESTAADVSSASQEEVEQRPGDDAAERPRGAVHAGLHYSLVNWYTPSDPAAAERAPAANTPFRQWASKRAPHLLRDLEPAADTESGLVDGQQANEFRAGDESMPTHVASSSDDESIATDVSSSVSEEDDPLEDAAERPLAVDAEPLQHLRPAVVSAVEEEREDGESRVTQFSFASEEGGPLDAAKWPHAAQGDAGGDIDLEDHDAAVGDDQVDKVLQQCTGDQLRASRDDQEVVQHGAIHPRDETICDTAAEDQEKVGSAENVDAVEGLELVQQDAIDRKGEGTDGTAAEDQDKAGGQCDIYGLGTTENGGAEDDQEAVEQCIIDKEGVAMNDNAVKDHEVVGPTVLDGMRATIDEISAEDQEKKLKQCSTYDSETIENDDAVEDQEVVEQGAVYRECLTIDHDAYVEDHKVVEQSITEEMPASTDDIAVVDQKEVVEQSAVHEPRATKDEYIVEEKEKVEDQEKKVEQCVTYDSETINNGDAVADQEVVEQVVVYGEGLTIEHDDYAEDHKVVEQSVIEGMPSSTDNMAVEDQETVVEKCAVHEPRATKDKYIVEEKEKVEDQENKMEQCVFYDSETIENGDAVDDQGVMEQVVVYREGLTIDHDDYAENHKVLEQSVIEGMPSSTDNMAVEDQETVVKQCAAHEPRATKDGYTVKEKEEVEEQGAIDSMKDQDKLIKQHIINNQGKLHMDDIVAKDCDKAAAQYASDAIITYREDDHVEEHTTVENQGGIEENGRTKDDVDVEEHDYLKEQVIVDNWGTLGDVSALEDHKNESEICNADEQIADKNMYVVHMKGSMLEQMTGSKQGATKSDFTVEKHKDVVERVCSEWAAPDDDLAMDMAASQSIREISSSEVVSATANGSDRGLVKENIKTPIRYPQRPGKLNCPFYMSKGSCSYGWSCQFHHPPLKSKTDGSWRPSEQGNHDVAQILELNRLGLPIREGARNCTYYMRNGACRYGKHCHFNHPEHVIDAQFYAPTGWEDNALQVEKSSDHTTLDNTSHLKKSSDDATLDDTSYLKKSSDHGTLEDTSYSKKSSDHATLEDTSYSKKSSDHATLDGTSSSSKVLPPNIFRMLLPPQKVLPSTERKVKKDSEWASTSDDSDGCCSADSSDGPVCKQEPVHSSDGPLSKQEHVDYPERPGRPECPFYMRFGDCKFASACKYHHSKDKDPTRYHPEVPSLGGKETEYPEIPGEPECPFYMKNRFCKFGAQCRFNHPKDLSTTAQSPTNAKRSVATYEHHQSTRIVVEEHVPQQQQYPERPGQPDCRYYLQFGKCKFMSACIYHHPRDRLPVWSNPSGPAHSDQIRSETHGMPECPFYMKSGKCQFGSACEFHHPKDICSTTEGEFGHRTDSRCDNFTRPENAVQTQEQIIYPERPGEPPCFNYMRHGSCRYQMNCKYHHPADRLSRKQYGSTYH